MATFADALQVKWPSISAREDQTVLLSFSPDGGVTPFDFTGFGPFWGAVNGEEGTTLANPPLFEIEVRVFGNAPNGDLFAKIPRSVSGGLQDLDVVRGSIDIFGANELTGDQLKFLEGRWALDLSTTIAISAPAPLAASATPQDEFALLAG